MNSDLVKIIRILMKVHGYWKKTLLQYNEEVMYTVDFAQNHVKTVQTQAKSDEICFSRVISKSSYSTFCT